MREPEAPDSGVSTHGPACLPRLLAQSWEENSRPAGTGTTESNPGRRLGLLIQVSIWPRIGMHEPMAPDPEISMHGSKRLPQLLTQRWEENLRRPGDARLSALQPGIMSRGWEFPSGLEVCAAPLGQERATGSFCPAPPATWLDGPPGFLPGQVL